MDYVAQTLRKDEKIIVQAKFNKWVIIAYLFPALICIILGIVISNVMQWAENAGLEKAPDFVYSVISIMSILFYVIGGLIFLIYTISILSCRLTVTNMRIIGKKGIISTNAIDIPINKVDSTSIQASFFGRLFKYYSLIIATTGNSQVSARQEKGLTLPAISNAYEVKNAIIDALEKYADDSRKAQAQEIASAMNNSETKKFSNR